jgi:hypothetical protein
MMGSNNKTLVIVMMSMMSTIMMLSRRSSSFVMGRRNTPAFVAVGMHRRQQQKQQQAQHVSNGAFTISSSLLSPKMSSTLMMSTTAEEHLQTVESSPSSSSQTPLLGIDWVREVVSTSLNEIFDPKEIARNDAIAKLDGKNKKKKNKKKKKDADDASATQKEGEEESEPKMSEEERNSMVEAAVNAALPFSTHDAMVTPATKAEFGDYQCNAAMSLAKSAGLNPRECATKIVDQLRPLIQDYMEEPEIAGPGFINLKFKDEYLVQALGVMVNDSMGRLGLPKAA